jgi:hypothetical protein
MNVDYTEARRLGLNILSRLETKLIELKMGNNMNPELEEDIQKRIKYLKEDLLLM